MAHTGILRIYCYIEKEAVSFKKFNFFKGDYKEWMKGC